MSARVEITGVLTRHTYATPHRSRNVLSALLADAIAPLPPSFIWTITDPNRPNYRGEPQFFKMKSGHLPAGLTEDDEGKTVHIKATVQFWDNTLGGYLSRVTVLDRVAQ